MTKEAKEGGSMFEREKPPGSYEVFIGQFVLLEYAGRRYMGKLDRLDWQHEMLCLEDVADLNTTQKRIDKVSMRVPMGGGMLRPVTEEAYAASVEQLMDVFRFVGNHVWIRGDNDNDFGLLEGLTSYSWVLKPALVSVPGAGYQWNDGPIYVPWSDKKRILPATEEDLKRIVSDSQQTIKIKELEDKIKLTELKKRAEELELK